MGLKSELFESAIESNSDATETNTEALWLGWIIIVVILILAILLARFIYRRAKNITTKLKNRL